MMKILLYNKPYVNNKVIIKLKIRKLEIQKKNNNKYKIHNKIDKVNNQMIKQ